MSKGNRAMNPHSRLLEQWRSKAKDLRRYGAAEAAATLETCALELEEEWRIWQTEPLTLEEASEECGYSYSALQKRVAAGEIPNAGDKGNPRVQRGHLPWKAAPKRPKLESGEPDLAAEILRLDLARL